MLDIIALFILCKKNGHLASQKGLKPGPWKRYTVLAWFVAEIAGLLLGLGLFGYENKFGILSLGLVSAFGGYLYIKSVLDKKQDPVEEEITRIGVDDLHPPRK